MIQIRYSITDTKDFKDFCNKNSLSIKEGLEYLIDLYEKLTTKAS